MESVDIAIIGAGVIGLAVASELAKDNRDIFIFEKNDSFGQETSSSNSEVIHAGIYYPPGSLKAVSCIQGRDILYSLCKKNNIPVKKTGKFIIASSDDEIEDLVRVHRQALENSIVLEFFDGKKIKQKESMVSCIAGLYSSQTGIIDSHTLMEFFLAKAESKGAELICKAEVIGIQRKNSQYCLTINNQGDIIHVNARIVINTAGHNADKIAYNCGIDIGEEKYEQYYLKGNYFKLPDSFRNTMRHLVYPVPCKHSLGIHTVLDLHGGIRFGPDEEEVDEIDYNVNLKKKKIFYESVKKFIPAIKENLLAPATCGIRPQLRHPNKGDFKDFIISHEEDKGLPGLINLIGMESPGLTSSPYIAQYVKNIVDKIL